MGKIKIAKPEFRIPKKQKKKKGTKTKEPSNEDFIFILITNITNLHIFRT
jgi:hypothetical protein